MPPSALSLQSLDSPTHRSLVCVFFSCLLISLAGCGYHQAGSATHIPADVHTLAVPIFVTRATAYHTEVAFTQAIIRELNTRTKYRILNTDSDSADATLHGTILTQTVAPLTYDANSGQSSSYLITITARVLLVAHDGHVLYRNDTIVYHEQYQSTQDLTGFIQEDGYAVKRVAKDFAQAVVSDMLESFE
jgi:outer membrane lipopolysaccharide assembly protein LptE/RlpB